ncbi:hypothetical protein [uncultured Micrococcus sp.]|uniref:hypothetical protein n=1 Tax=uncultured Micrococcus sp. TaxID=114051 RepID=UPI0025FD331C|nr:hypothetical protein [uncultured Micrococcus sp.]
MPDDIDHIRCPGVAFQDITPLLADARALRACVEALVAPFEGCCDLVAGLEARGFLLDDVLATGGTRSAGRRLIEARGAEVVGAACLLELTTLGGRAVVPDTHVLFAA